MSVQGKNVSLKDLFRVLDIEPPPSVEDLTVSRVCSPQNVENPCAVVILEERHLKDLSEVPTLLVVKKGLKVPKEVKGKTILLEVENPRLALAKILKLIYPEEHPVGVSSKASLGQNLQIGKDVYIGDFVYIGNNVRIGNGVKIYPGCYIGDNTQIGDETVIYPNAVIFPNTVIGRNVKIYSGAVIGKDGFGFVFHKGEHIRLHHGGIVEIGDNVEIGANSCVDRALLDRTEIGAGTKIDNLVQVAHNDKLGRGVILVSQVGLSGSVEVGDYSVLAGQVGVADHVKIGSRVTVVAKSGVTKHLKDGKIYGAVLPAMEWNRWKKLYALFLKLPQLLEKLKEKL